MDIGQDVNNFKVWGLHFGKWTGGNFDYSIIVQRYVEWGSYSQSENVLLNNSS